MNKSTVTGFVKGFLVTCFLLLFAGALAGPMIGRAQDGPAPNNLEQDAADAGEASPRTDDPLGRQQIPLDEVQHPPNDAYAVPDAAAAANRTDDPLGRTRIPLAAGVQLPANNAAGELQGDAQFDPALSQANIAHEAALQQAASQPYTSPLVVSAADFSADGFDPDSMFFSFGGGYFAGNSANYGCVIAPAYLPQGVTVTDMFATVFDNDGTRNLTVSLRRVDNFSGTGATMAAATSSGAFNGVQVISTAAISEPLVRYPDFSYYLTTCLGSNLVRIYSVRLYYTEP